MAESGDNGSMKNETEAVGSGASNELLLEFLDSVMYKRFDTALLLCRKIIDKEPDNYEARAFLPMLEEAHSIKSKGYFNPLDYTSSEESDESSDEDSDHKKDRRRSSSSSQDWEYSTTTSESEDGSDNDDAD